MNEETQAKSQIEPPPVTDSQPLTPKATKGGLGRSLAGLLPYCGIGAGIAIGEIMFHEYFEPNPYMSPMKPYFTFGFIGFMVGGMIELVILALIKLSSEPAPGHAGVPNITDEPVETTTDGQGHTARTDTPELQSLITRWPECLACLTEAAQLQTEDKRKYQQLVRYIQGKQESWLLKELAKPSGFLAYYGLVLQEAAQRGVDLSSIGPHLSLSNLPRS